MPAPCARWGFTTAHDWAANWLQAVLSSIVTAAIATGMCEAIGFIEHLQRNVLYVVILVYLLALYSFAFFISSLVKSVRSHTTARRDGAPTS